MCSTCGAVAPITTDWFWTEVALLRERWDVLEHPFYQRWSAGQLSPAELQAYASEYHHAVVAIADASVRAARLADGDLRRELEQHAAEELEHIDLWMQFARATGWCAGTAWFFSEDAYEETLACARAWSGSAARSLSGHLVTLYAIESAQPQISETKLAGLLEHYGFTDGPATEYFRLHARGDHAHAALARQAFERTATGEDPFALLRDVEASYRAYWGMLDRLEAECRSS
jgi:pyrroloquinoline-quinone synthase